MKKKKITVISGLMLIVVLAFSAGVSAASTLEKIQANLNHGLSFVLNGEAWTPKDANGKKAAPISYKGTTYVPLRAVGEATGAEVSFNSAKQQIQIITSSASVPSSGERVPFGVDHVSHFKWGGYLSGVTRNKNDLLFGETQYETAFIVNDVNSAGQGVAFKVKEGTKRVGVLVGFKSISSDKIGSYTISTKDGQALAAGKVESGKLENNELVLPRGTTELFVEFKGPAGEKSTGFVIWDESWLEF